MASPGDGASGGGRLNKALIAGIVGAALMGWFIYVLFSSVSCVGVTCAGVSNLSALAFPVGLVLVLVGAFTGGGFLVVPILFLAIGAASLAVGALGQMPDMPVFPWLFGGFFVLGGLAPFFLGFVARRIVARKQVIAAELMRSGVKGIATIVAVEDTGITLNENPRVRLHMRIDPVDGSPAVERSKTVTVSRVGVPRPGERYPAWFDRADPDKWMYGTDMQANAPAEVKEMFARARADRSGRARPEPEASPVEELAQLTELWKEGALTDAEFADAKARLLPRIGR